MTTKREQALNDLEATCEDLADLDEAFKRGRLQGLEEAAKIADQYFVRWFSDRELCGKISAKIRQEENTHQ
jgi:hypothetical protein